MERIVYRITLDAHKNGIQRTLQGFETSDNISRRIAVTLVSGGDTYEISQDVTAVMYVTTPNASEPSINSCVIENNTIIYDALPIVEEGITEMQLKLIGTSLDGATSVLVSPRFAVEVCASGTGESGATQTTTFTALEDALAQAKAVHDSRLVKVEIDTDCTFRAYYADGTVYENYFFKEALYNGNALLSESFAHGGTGVRTGEETDNSKYYSNVSRSAAEDADRVYDEAQVMLEESRLQTSFTAFGVDFNTGELTYMSANYEFDINETTGNLEAHNDGSYDPEDIVGAVVDEFIDVKSKEIDKSMMDINRELSNTNANVSNALAILQENTFTLETHQRGIGTNTQAIQEIEQTLGQGFIGDIGGASVKEAIFALRESSVHKIGETVSISTFTSGYVTSGGASVYFVLPTSKSIPTGAKITASTVNGFILRQNGKYTNGSSSGSKAIPKEYSAWYIGTNAIQIKATFDDTTNVTNNDTIGIVWEGTITFS